MAMTEVPRSAAEGEQRRKLVVTRRQAGALLVFVTMVFVVVTVIGADGGLGYVQATAEAAMVGGLADWFAVTALFRRPLGLPIPHTAIIPERKDRFGQTLGSFISDAFLTPDTVVERLRSSKVVERAAAWLATPTNADRVAGYLLSGAVVMVDFLNDDEIQNAIEGAARKRFDAIELAPTAGRALESLTRDGRHQPLVDAALDGLARYLDENRQTLHDRFEEASPWWLPGAVEDRIFGRLIDGARAVLDDMVRSHEHELRRHLDERIAALIDDLQTSPDLRARGEQIKADLLEQPAIREYVGTAWESLKTSLRAEANNQQSELRARLAEAIADAGVRFRDDPALLAVIDFQLERAARFVVEHYQDEFTALITGTIARWDGKETADRLELLLGPDLQFIRINGTVVGGLAGLVLHSVAEVLG